MAQSGLFRLLTGVTTVNLALAGGIYYNTNTLLERNHEEAGARMDELEGTLRGHIGLMEESLGRIEDTLAGKKVEGGWGKGMGKKTEEMYLARGRDEKIRRNEVGEAGWLRKWECNSMGGIVRCALLAG